VFCTNTLDGEHGELPIDLGCDLVAFAILSLPEGCERALK